MQWTSVVHSREGSSSLEGVKLKHTVGLGLGLCFITIFFVDINGVNVDSC